MPLHIPPVKPPATPPKDSQEALYAQQRALGNIDPIPFAQRTPEDHRAYLPIILAEIAAYNRIDDPRITLKGCIAPGDQAFTALIQKLNDTRAALVMPALGIDDVPHEPWCKPQVLGSGPRR